MTELMPYYKIGAPFAFSRKLECPALSKRCLRKRF
jgi:hypothetical protein